MRNRLASLIVVKQEPANSLNYNTNSSNIHDTFESNHLTQLNYTEIGQFPLTAAAQVPANNLQLISTIKTERLQCDEINNNHLNQCENFNYHLHQNQNNCNKQSAAAASNTPLIYPCRNLFPDGCDISSHLHHNHNHNCSNYTTTSTTFAQPDSTGIEQLKDFPDFSAQTTAQLNKYQFLNTENSAYDHSSTRTSSSLSPCSSTTSSSPTTNAAGAISLEQQWSITNLCSSRRSFANAQQGYTSSM